MRHCTVRYSVRLIPKAANAMAMDAVAIFREERAPDETGEPGDLVSRQLTTFSGPTGDAIRERVVHDREWDVDIRNRLGPLEWDD